MAVQHNSTAAGKGDEFIIDELVRSAKGLRFGQIVLTVHNSRIVQIDKTEKIRLDDGTRHDKGSGI